MKEVENLEKFNSKEKELILSSLRSYRNIYRCNNPTDKVTDAILVQLIDTFEVAIGIQRIGGTRCKYQNN
jgi:hypothetical protein